MNTPQVDFHALLFIEKHYKDHKYSPSVRDIGKAVGYSSSSSAQKIIDGLRRRGYIYVDQANTKSICRAIRISEEGERFLKAVKKEMAKS